jgi:hypothetical protein
MAQQWILQMQSYYIWIVVGFTQYCQSNFPIVLIFAAVILHNVISRTRLLPCNCLTRILFWPNPSGGFVFETAGVVQHTHFKLFFIGFKLVQWTITNFVRLKNLASLIKKCACETLFKYSSDSRDLTLEICCLNIFLASCLRCWCGRVRIHFFLNHWWSFYIIR